MGIPPVFPSDRQVTRLQALAGKLVIICIMGITIGLAIEAQMNADFQRSQSLTLEEYVADFDEYKEDLRSSEMPPAASVAAGVIFTFTVFGVYEILGLGVGRLFATATRRRHRMRMPEISDQ
ncbi:MAG: hypothetical protein P8X82_16075 [Gemmatimonadales bacterium]|jgi:hypothetical protein